MTPNRLPNSPCPVCGKKLDAASESTGAPVKPVEGDFSVCLYCGALLRFGAHLVIVKASLDELMQLQTEQPLTFKHLMEIRDQARVLRQQRQVVSRYRGGGRPA